MSCRSGASPLALRAKEMTKHIGRRHRRTQNEQAHAARHGNTNFCVLLSSSVDALPFWAQIENQDLWTTDVTDHTDEERPDSKSVQSVSSVVQNRPQATDLRRQERSVFGRKRLASDARRTIIGRKTPRDVITPSCACYSSSGPILKTSDGSDAKSRNTLWKRGEP